MVPNKQSPSRRSGKTAQPKSFDIASPRKRQAKPRFPEIGVTLSSYAPSNNDGQKRSSFTPHIDQPKQSNAWRSKFTKKRVIIGVLLIILVIVGWLGFKFAYNAQRLFGGNVFSVLTTSKLKGEDQGRVNVLLAGNSADDPGHQGGTLTDSIMILSIDTKNNSAYMLSVPRDLYVKIGNSGRAKINTAYPTGESKKFTQSGYADGGMGLLQKTIYENLGISTQYYALVNYNALRDSVNSVGGIDVVIKSSNPKGLYDPSKDYSTGGVLVKLANGKQHLNGQQALNLARARGDARGSYGFPNSDFNRTENQRMLILALRSKATSAGVLTNPIKLGNLFDSVGNNVETDMDLGNVRRLYELTKDISGSNIKSIGLNNADGVNLLANYRTPRGESALVPAAGMNDFSDIKRYIQRLTSTNLVVRENATVVLLNGTSISGLASKESATLEAKNILVGTINDADTEDYTKTQIINLSANKKPATLKALQANYPGAMTTATNPFGTKYTADFIVILGNDRSVEAATE